MLERPTIAGFAAALLLLVLILPAAGVTASMGLPALATALVSDLVPEAAPRVPGLEPPACGTELEIETLFAPQALASSCTSACRDLYFSCLDDCVVAPFPGCADHCRFDVLYPCYASCF